MEEHRALADRQIKKASIVSVGNEVLSGKTVDTNAAYVGRQLILAGLPVASSYTVADRQEAIVRALTLAAEDADVVIVTGGLGPTDDDVTRQAFAKFLGVELEQKPDLLARIEEFFQRRGVQMPQRNTIQACIPKGAEAVPNDWGTAPGIVATKGDVVIFSLPGVPREMERMLQASVVPRLRGLSRGQAVAVRRVKCFGAGESVVAEMIGDAMNRDRNPLVNCTVNSEGITLEVVGVAASQGGADGMADSEAAALRHALGALVYGTGDETLAEVVGRQLAATHSTLATAESCTGGLLGKLVTDVPGASRYFIRGWITYSNEAKTEDLGVPTSLIERHGAVSEQVAQAMAQGARRKAGSAYAIGITGIAGPDGGTREKPVGLVYISLDCQDGTETLRYIFPTDRDNVRSRAALTALNMLRRRLGI
jgi:nicotinamide-nucleotide amidase